MDDVESLLSAMTSYFLLHVPIILAIAGYLEGKPATDLV